jgi:methanogenic corrinoid protein MtbC1
MKDSEMNSLIAAILEGDCAKAVSQVEQLRAGGISSQNIVMCGIEPAMLALDSKCTLEQFNLLEIMLAGRAVTEVMKLLSSPPWKGMYMTWVRISSRWSSRAAAIA